jgi:hypothetical protein
VHAVLEIGASDVAVVLTHLLFDVVAVVQDGTVGVLLGVVLGQLLVGVEVGHGADAVANQLALRV